MSKQKLNSLDRFRKRSPRLLLEEHSGCEVPAGCGGVVMRWRNPLEARPIRVLLYTPAMSVVWIDGASLSVGRLDLRPGRHVLAVEISEVARAAGLLMAVLRHDPAERAPKDTPPFVVEPPLNILSADDGSWRFTLEQPAEGWQALDFDDSGWDALVGRPIPAVAWNELNGYQWQTCNKEKAAGLGVPGGHPGVSQRGQVRVRKVFEVPEPPVT
jgi:hypothetical protein